MNTTIQAIREILEEDGYTTASPLNNSIELGHPSPSLRLYLHDTTITIMKITPTHSTYHTTLDLADPQVFEKSNTPTTTTKMNILQAIHNELNEQQITHKHTSITNQLTLALYHTTHTLYLEHKKDDQIIITYCHTPTNHTFTTTIELSNPTSIQQIIDTIKNWTNTK